MQIHQLSFCYVCGAEWGSIPTHITKAFYIFVRQLQFPPFLLPKPLVFLRFSSHLLNGSRSTVANVGSAARPLHVIKILRQHSIHTHAHTRTRHTHTSHAHHTHVTRTSHTHHALIRTKHSVALQQSSRGGAAGGREQAQAGSEEDDARRSERSAKWKDDNLAACARNKCNHDEPFNVKSRQALFLIVFIFVLFFVSSFVP